MSATVVASLTDTDARAAWAYINEGNAAAVFAYCGPTHEHFDRTVLRLRKTSSSANSQVDEQSLATDEDDAEDPMLAFQRVAIEPLVPPEYRARIESVILDRDWLASFAEAHGHNLRAGQAIDQSRSRATLAENLIGFPWAVEIKVCSVLRSRIIDVNHRCRGRGEPLLDVLFPFGTMSHIPRAYAWATTYSRIHLVFRSSADTWPTA